MDIGGTTGETGFPFGELPLGFGIALAGNEMAMQGYARLTETEKEHLILRCKDARSKEEMERIVNSLVPGDNLDAVLTTEKEQEQARPGEEKIY
nr:hypothetical protein [uncultured Acetatifactor sp.]